MCAVSHIDTQIMYTVCDVRVFADTWSLCLNVATTVAVSFRPVQLYCIVPPGLFRFGNISAMMDVLRTCLGLLRRQMYPSQGPCLHVGHAVLGGMFTHHHWLLRSVAVLSSVLKYVRNII